MKKEELINFMESFEDSIDKGNLHLYNGIINSSSLSSLDSPEDFFFSVLYPWENFISAFIQLKISSDKEVVYIYKNSEVIDRHFSRQFQKYEGSACSADKSRTVVRCLLDFFLSGEEIKFDYKQEYTYHLPNKIFKTHSEILDFYKAIKDIQYGRAEKYIEEIKKLEQL